MKVKVEMIIEAASFNERRLKNKILHMVLDIVPATKLLQIEIIELKCKHEKTHMANGIITCDECKKPFY